MVLTLLVLVFGVGVLLLFRHHEDAAKKPAAAPAAITVTTATAKKGDIGVYLDAIGTVTPVYTASITSQVNGMVMAVHFTEGQMVQKGDPLIDIDPRPYRATLLQAQGDAASGTRTCWRRRRWTWSATATPWRARPSHEQMLDDQEKLVLQDEGTVKNDQGTVQYDQVQLDFCHITSPIAGRVGLRLVDPGNVVQSAGTTTLAVITQIQPITVVFTIPEDSLGQIEARLRTGAKLPWMRWTARIRRKSRPGRC